MKTLFILSAIFFIACARPNEPLDNAETDNNRNYRNFISGEEKFDTPNDFNEDIYAEYIPQNLTVFLNKEMPDRKIPAPNKWGYWFNEYKTSNNLVNFVSGDFNCDERTDYALILADERKELSVWVFFSKRNGFEKIKLEDFGEYSDEINFGLSILKPGMHKYDWNPAPVNIKCQAVEVYWFEKAGEAYYWDNGKFKSITTND